MNLFAFVSAVLLILPGGAALAQTKPEDFSSRMNIETGAEAPYYRFTVPMEAYLQSARGDLRDLAVFDSAGKAVPFARLAAAGSTRETRQRASLPWFPIAAAAGGNTAAAGDASIDVVVKQAADGTLVEVKGRGPAAGQGKPKFPAVRGYVLDASKIANRAVARSLEIDWDKGGSDFQLLDIDASDDLQHWSGVRAAVQLARLSQGSERIENRRIDLPGLEGRYLRLTWRNPEQAPQLTQAEMETVSASFSSAPLAWSSPVSGAKERTGEYRFHLPRPLPLARLRLELPAGNVLLPVSVSVPAPTADRQRREAFPLASATLYRILENGREWMQSEIPLEGQPVQDFMLRIDSRGGYANDAATLVYALEPAQIVFLAGGKPPYTLAIGNAKATDSALAPATLIPGFGNSQSPQVKEARVGGIERNDSVPAAASPTAPSRPDEQNWKKTALWGILIAGVLGMAAMAWQLFKQMNRSEAEKP